MFGLVGPSGSGKSTLLRLLNFLEPPTSGTIHFAGTGYNGNASVPVEVRRRVTTVFQRPLLLKRSVRDNVRYGLGLRGRDDTAEMVDEVLERVGMRAMGRSKARSLSAGEAQRVALARAMILEPEVLLLDEPTANLDPYNVQLMESIVRDLNQQRGTTIVLVTHNIFQARRMAHRVGLLLEGGIVEVAGATDFFESPQDPRTEAFVGGEMIY
jgi:tungstate transport system ATP-binding protein